MSMGLMATEKPHVHVPSSVFGVNVKATVNWTESLVNKFALAKRQLAQLFSQRDGGPRVLGWLDYVHRHTVHFSPIKTLGGQEEDEKGDKNNNNGGTGKSPGAKQRTGIANFKTNTCTQRGIRRRSLQKRGRRRSRSRSRRPVCGTGNG
ncbi:hypothetical protein RUM43_002423 [Polyplax serrata]|uniref:Uncharacterized protein n=1 Tax=Polyplax serrata TaxID=468196 RepID=A0AAN8PZI5_POLSC